MGSVDAIKGALYLVRDKVQPFAVRPLVLLELNICSWSQGHRLVANDFAGPVYLFARVEVVVPRLYDKLVRDTRRDEYEVEHLLKRQEEVHLLELGHILCEVYVLT